MQPIVPRKGNARQKLFAFFSVFPSSSIVIHFPASLIFAPIFQPSLVGNDVKATKKAYERAWRFRKSDLTATLLEIK